MKKELVSYVMIGMVWMCSVFGHTTFSDEGGGEKGAKPCQYEDTPRPSVLLSGSLLETLKTAIQKNTWKADLYHKKVKANADLWVDRDITIPVRAGEYHRFFCADGTRLDVPENQEFTTRDYRCPSCGKDYSGDQFDGGRRWFEHNWLVYACRDLALTGLIEEDDRYLFKAGEILVKYADAYPGRRGILSGGIMHTSLGEAVMMIPLAHSYDLIYDSNALNEQDKSHIEQDLFWKSGNGLIGCGLTANWGSWHLSAVGIIGNATRHQRFIDYATAGFKSQIENQLGSDGLWPESVHTYHFYSLLGFINLAEAHANLGIDLYNWVAPNGKSLKKMFTAPLAYAYPNTQLPAINDGWYQSILPGEHYEAAYYRYELPEMGQVLKKAYRQKERGYRHNETNPDSLWAWILGGPLPSGEEVFSHRSTDFSNIGICTLRNGADAGKEIMLTFDYGRFLKHGNYDKMGITLYANDRILAADYGTPGYGSSILSYYRGGSAHNVVVVDQKTQKKSKTGVLSKYYDSPIFKVAESSSDEVYPGVLWQRKVLLMDRYVVLIDDLSSDQEHVYDWFFHSEFDRMALTKGREEAGLGSAFGYSYMTDVTGYKPSGKDNRAYAQWDFDDQTALALEMLTDSDMEIFTGRAPAETGARAVPFVAIRKKGTHAQFISLLYPYDTNERLPKPKVTHETESSVVIRSGEITDEISWKDELIFERSRGGKLLERKVVLELLLD